MAVPVGYVAYAMELSTATDPDPWYVTWGCETDLANFSALEHCNDAYGSFVGAWDQDFSTAITLTKVIGRFGFDGPGDIIVESDITPTAGGSNTAKLPQNCALLVKKNTGLGGRRNRGRMYIPNVLSEVSVSETGAISTTTVANYQTNANTFLANLEADGGGIAPSQPMVILHTPDPSTGIAPTPTLVSSLTVDPTLATQRRRLR